MLILMAREEIQNNKKKVECMVLKFICGSKVWFSARVENGHVLPFRFSLQKPTKKLGGAGGIVESAHVKILFASQKNRAGRGGPKGSYILKA